MNRDQPPTVKYRYQTIEFGDCDIHVRTLKDRQQFADDKGVAARLGISAANWSFFGVIWPAGYALAHVVNHCPIKNKRILEVGCGIGLASLVLNRRLADITATDYHPKAEAFMRVNTELNGDRTIPFERTSWQDSNDRLGKFDLIIGSDVLYEEGNVNNLISFIAAHARPSTQVLIVDPGRGQTNRFARGMAEEGYGCIRSKSQRLNHLPEDFKGYLLELDREPFTI